MIKYIVLLIITLLISELSFPQRTIIDSIDKVNELSWIQSEFDIITSLENSKWCYQKKLKNEIIAILTMIDKDKNNESKKDEIYNLLIDIYGGLSNHSFQNFMKTNFNF